MEINELSERPDLISKATDYLWKCWGNESNYLFYKDCIDNSLNSDSLLPKFYLLLDKENIIGSCALLRNDLISRQDLSPWFACLFVNKEFRNKGLAGQLIEHALSEARSMSFSELYLCTTLNNFYEKKGWKFFSIGYNLTSDEVKIYSKKTI